MTNATLTLPERVTRLDHDWRIDEIEAREAGLYGAPDLALFWGTARRAMDNDLWQFSEGELQAAAPYAQGFFVYDGGKVAYLPAMAYRWACAQVKATPVDAPEPDAAEPDPLRDAAPDLLAALRDLHACHRAFSGADNWTALDDDARAAAEAAIAKAEGR